MGCKYMRTPRTFGLHQTQNPMRFAFSAFFALSTATLSSQVFSGLGSEFRSPSAQRLVNTQSAFSQIGYQWGDFAAVGQFRVPSGTPHWTKPSWFAGARLEWSAYQLPTDSLPLAALKAADWHVVVSGQWSRLDGHRYRSEHLGGFDTDHWTREIYQFQYGRNEFLVGLGLQGRFGSWSALAEVQYGPGAQLDTWVYKSNLYLDGTQTTIDDYYYYERYSVLRASLTLRKHLGF
jgi:hypothetical protein